MKKIFALVVVFVILLAGCQQVDPTLNSNPDDSTAPSQNHTTPSDTNPIIFSGPIITTRPATEPSTEPSTAPTEAAPNTALPAPQDTPLSQEQLEYYQEQLTYTSNNKFYNLATTTVFSHPKEINLRQLFYNGIARELDILTDEEYAYFSSKIQYLDAIDVHVLSPDNMNRILMKVFGISLEETDKRGLDEFQYWEETDCYYWFGTDANGNWDIQVQGGSMLADGTIQILYSSVGAYQDAGLSYTERLWVMTLSPQRTILSNLPAE